MAISLYRKYRPNVFSDVVGQKHVESTLINAVSEGNVAHAYLFCGPRGTGKTTTARLLAKALICENVKDGQPCGTCEQCEAIACGAHPDVYELDAASNTGVDNVREEIISRVNFAPTRGRCKVYIIDEVHMLSTSAFNALLKTFEEPPERVVFIMCTTDPHKVPETIQSRCQRFDFKRLSVAEIVSYLERICTAEGFDAEPEALEYIAAKSSGGMRDATTSLEQLATSSTDGKLTLAGAQAIFSQVDSARLFELTEHIAAHDTASCFTWLASSIEEGCDLTQCARDLAAHVRNLYVAALTGGADGIIACSAAELEDYRAQAKAFGAPERLSRALKVCGELLIELRNSSNARLSTEIALTRLARPESDLTLEALEERIAALEKQVASGAPAQAGAGQAAGQDLWPTAVAAAEPHWKQIAREQKEQRAKDAPAASVPLEQAVAAELKAEEALADEAAGFDAASKPDAQAGQAADAVEVPAAQEEAPAQPAASGKMSPARLLAAVLTVVRREDVATGALLNGVTLEQGPNGCTLLFPKGSEFSMRIASKGNAAELIGKAFAEVLGAPCQFTCKLGSGAAPTAAPAADAAAGSPYDEAPMYEPPVYDDYDDAGYAAAQEDYASGNADDGTAADIASALSVFGDGIQVQEVPSDK